MFFRLEPSLTSMKENPLESRRVRTHPFINTGSIGRSDFKSLNIFVRSIGTPLFNRSSASGGLSPLRRFKSGFFYCNPVMAHMPEDSLPYL
jgi:hypothetical protein